MCTLYKINHIFMYVPFKTEIHHILVCQFNKGFLILGLHKKHKYFNTYHNNAQKLKKGGKRQKESKNSFGEVCIFFHNDKLVK